MVRIFAVDGVMADELKIDAVEIGQQPGINRDLPHEVGPRLLLG